MKSAMQVPLRGPFGVDRGIYRGGQFFPTLDNDLAWKTVVPYLACPSTSASASASHKFLVQRQKTLVTTPQPYRKGTKSARARRIRDTPGEPGLAPRTAVKEAIERRSRATLVATPTCARTSRARGLFYFASRLRATPGAVLDLRSTQHATQQSTVQREHKPRRPCTAPEGVQAVRCLVPAGWASARRVPWGRPGLIPVSRPRATRQWTLQPQRTRA